MIDELNDFYLNCLLAIRTEERAASMYELVELLTAIGYEDELSRGYALAKDNVESAIGELESIIVKCTASLGQKLGLELNIDAVYKSPRNAVALLKVLLGDMEDYEDFETLHGLATIEETPEYILESILRVIYSDNSIYLEEMILSAEPRLMAALLTYLESKMIANADSDFDIDVTQRMLRYLRVLPSNPAANLFVYSPHLLEPEKLAKDLDCEVEGFNYLELEVMYLVGLCVLDSDTYDEAYRKLVVRVELISSERDVYDHILRESVEPLKQIYTEATDGQEEVFEGSM